MTSRRVLALAALLLLAACGPGPKPVAPLAQSGELVVLTVNGPSTYFEDAQGLPSGFEYDLVNLFAQVDIAFNVGKPVEYAWLVASVDKARILQAAQPFFERIRKDGTLKRLVDRYYGHALRMNSIDSGALLEKIPVVLPKLKPFL